MALAGTKDDIDYLLNQASRSFVTQSRLGLESSSVGLFAGDLDDDPLAGRTLSSSFEGRSTTNRYSLDDFTATERSSVRTAFNEKGDLAWVGKHNYEVYEARVAKAFMDECLGRALYRHRMQQHSHQLRDRHREVATMHRRIEAAIPTPRAVRRAEEARVHAVLSAMNERATPRFRDLDELAPLIESSRQQGGQSLSPLSAAASPALPSPALLARAVPLPPLHQHRLH